MSTSSATSCMKNQGQILIGSNSFKNVYLVYDIFFFFQWVEVYHKKESRCPIFRDCVSFSNHHQHNPWKTRVYPSEISNLFKNIWVSACLYEWTSSIKRKVDIPFWGFSQEIHSIISIMHEKKDSNYVPYPSESSYSFKNV